MTALGTTLKWRPMLKLIVWFAVIRLSFADQLPDCEAITGTHGTIESPGYPEPYAANLNCEYRFAEKDRNNRVTIHWLKFEIQEKANVTKNATDAECPFDGLVVDGVAYCGAQLSGKTLTLQLPTTLRFYSNNETNAPGFRATYKLFHKYSKESHKDIQKRSGVLMSAGYPEHYSNDMLATYTFSNRWLTTQQFCGVDLDFKDFSLEQSIRCAADSLRINNDVYCGQQLKSSILKLRLPVNMTMVTDDQVSYAGFLVVYKYRIHCDEGIRVVLDKKTGAIQTPGYPKPYANNVLATYVFPALKDHCAVRLNFVSFQLQKSPSCTCDSLKVHNETLCGQELNRKTVDLRVPTKLTFQSDDKSIDYGFLATYSYLENCDQVCGADISSITGYITPPIQSPDEKYDDDIHCSFNIHKHHNARCVLLTFTRLDLCNVGDYLEVQGEKYCSLKQLNVPKLKVPFPENGGPVSMNFVTNSAESKPLGFLVKYIQESNQNECPLPRCQAVETKEEGDLYSPGYPKAYKKLYTCEYVIRSFNKSRNVYLRVDIPPAKGDTLTVTTGNPKQRISYGEATKIAFETGTDLPLPTVVVKFASDEMDENKFKVSYFQGNY